MASNVPKFASFRPKLKPAPELPREHQTSEVRAKSSSKSKRPGERTESRASEPPKVERDATSSKLYFSDRRGDADVLKYGALNRYNIPAYRRSGYGYVLGLGFDQKIDRERSSHSKIYMTPVSGHRQERLLTAKNVPKEGSRTLRIVPSNENPILAEGQDFIAVSDGRNRRRDDSDGDKDKASPDLDYRGVERDSDQPLDLDTQYDDNVEDLASISELTKKNSELVRKTREHPRDIQAWLSFIEHQEAMMAPDRAISDTNDATRRQLADVRILIYEEALKKTLDEFDNHVRLYKGLLVEAQRSWTEAKLTTRWQEVLRIHPGSTELRLMYLDFVQSNFSSFKYEACRMTFLQSLEALRASKVVVIETTLHVFIRLTSMTHDAGYQELALAIWQAILELSLSQPAMSTADLEDFEQFWESEAPRVGEVEASGWRKTARKDLPANATPLIPPDPQESAFQDFCKRENDSIAKLRYPGRTSDEVGEDDAFHTIFFGDIEPYLKVIPADTPNILLVEAFLCFCGLPPLSRTGDHQRSWWNDPFILPPRVSVVAPAHARDSEHISFTDKVERFSACGTSNFQTASELLFDHDFSLKGKRLDPDFIRRTVGFAATETQDEALGEYLLAFEHRHFPVEVVKTAKRLLKAKPTSQCLYHAYGLVEARREKYEKANQVFSMAFSMGSPGTHESLMLLSSWVWEALQDGDQVDALWRLTSISGKPAVKTKSMLRPCSAALETASMAISEACAKALLQHDYPCAVVGTSLLALLAYLSNDGIADLAITAHHRLSDWFASHHLSASPYAELNGQALARFLSYHVTHAPIVKPALIRSALEPFISMFPSNTILLSLYAANEARFAIDDRVRGIMHQTALQGSYATTVAGWSFAIHFEMLRGRIAGSTSHSIRALYKRATHSESSGTHSPALWTSYLRFEIAQMQSERAKTKDRRRGVDGKKRTWERRLAETEERVKETFYAGLRSLPWCKDFIMLAFEDATRSVFGEEELWRVYRVMQEKELRVYVELD
jgi:hypothetical protein